MRTRERKGRCRSSVSESLAFGSDGTIACRPQHVTERSPGVTGDRESEESDELADMVGRDATVPDMAASALRLASPYHLPAVRDVVAALVRDQRFGLAYHLARRLRPMPLTSNSVCLQS